MGKPSMTHENVDRRIEHLKNELGFRKKIDVIRAGLSLLEKEVEREKKIKRWKQATKLVAKNSAKVNKEFQSNSRSRSD